MGSCALVGAVVFGLAAYAGFQPMLWGTLISAYAALALYVVVGALLGCILVGLFRLNASVHVESQINANPHNKPRAKSQKRKNKASAPPVFNAKAFQEQLFAAAGKGETGSVVQLIEDPNCTGHLANQCLQEAMDKAISGGHIKTLKALMDHSLLYWALPSTPARVTNNKKEISRMKCEKAIEVKQYDIALYLIDMLSPYSDAQSRILLQAIKSEDSEGRSRVIENLLEKLSAHHKESTHYLRNPLRAATEQKDGKTVTLLLAKISDRSSYVSQNKGRLTELLYRAVQDGSLEVVQAFVVFSLELLEAVLVGNDSMVALLVEKCPQLLGEENGDKETALMMAKNARNPNQQIITYLEQGLAANADTVTADRIPGGGGVKIGP